MIFITVGTQKFQFNRLLRSIDSLIEKKVINDTIVCQSGYSTYVPKYYKTVKFLSAEQYGENIKQCSLLITHAGVGTILSAIKLSKPIIVISRLEKFEEHVDDHQLQIAEGFNKKKLVMSANAEIDSLSKAIRQVKTSDLETYKSNQAVFISKFEKIMNGIEKR